MSTAEIVLWTVIALVFVGAWVGIIRLAWKMLNGTYREWWNP